MWEDDDDFNERPWFQEPSFEEEIMLEEQSYMKVDSADDFWWAFCGHSLKDRIHGMTDFNDFDKIVTMLEDTRPLVTEVYDTLRRHYEKLEDYEACQKCIHIERELRVQLLKLQVHYEKVEQKTKERQARRMGLQKPKK